MHFRFNRNIFFYGFNFMKQHISFKYILVLSVVILFSIASGCIGEKTSNNETKISHEGSSDKNRIATIVTEKGTIKFELYEKEAPITTQNFIELAQKGFYDGLTFHRVESGKKMKLIQGGDPNGDGTGGSGKTIPLEINATLSHIKGAVGMARSQDPNSASSQFYILLGDAKFLDKNYAVFGQVIAGQDVAEKITKGDKMIKVTIGSE
jgi:peptidyl-prolyl cis-trans isomerase B (cyclophilin B)